MNSHFTYTHIHTHIHAHARKYTHLHARAHTHTHTHPCTHTHTHAHTRTCTHMHAHTHTRTHTLLNLLSTFPFADALFVMQSHRSVHVICSKKIAFRHLGFECGCEISEVARRRLDQMNWSGFLKVGFETNYHFVVEKSPVCVCVSD